MFKRLFKRGPRFKVTRVIIDVTWNPRAHSHPKYWNWGGITDFCRSFTIVDAIDKGGTND